MCTSSGNLHCICSESKAITLISTWYVSTLLSHFFPSLLSFIPALLALLLAAGLYVFALSGNDVLGKDQN